MVNRVPSVTITHFLSGVAARCNATPPSGPRNAKAVEAYQTEWAGKLLLSRLACSPTGLKGPLVRRYYLESQMGPSIMTADGSVLAEGEEAVSAYLNGNICEGSA